MIVLVKLTKEVKPNPVWRDRTKCIAGAEEPIFGANLHRFNKPKLKIANLNVIFDLEILRRRTSLSPSPSANFAGIEKRLKSQLVFYR